MKYRYRYKITKLNKPDIEKKLKENDGYCPCSIIRNEDTKCMCKEFRESKILAGTCHCGLYYKELIQDKIIY